MTVGFNLTLGKVIMHDTKLLFAHSKFYFFLTLVSFWAAFVPIMDVHYKGYVTVWEIP